MTWLVDALRQNPALALFLVLAIGYALGQVRIGTFQPGPVLGSLIAGLAIGQLGIAIPGSVKNIFFLLFVFAIGLRTGAEFFRGLRSSALPQLAVIATLIVSAVALTWGVARIWHLDGGTAAGLLSGALTNSTSLGTATDATASLTLEATARDRLAQNATTTYALTYLVGLIAVVAFLSYVAPRLMRVNLKDASRELEHSLGMTSKAQSMNSAYQPIVVRGYRLPATLDGLTVAEVENQWPAGQRAIVTRVRRGDVLLDAQPGMRLHDGDVVAVAGWSTALIGDTNPLEDHETHDRRLLEIPMISADIVLTNRTLGGQSVRTLAERIGARGIFLLGVRRAGRDLPASPAVIVERGDVLNVSGARAEVLRVAAELGYAEYPTSATDLFLVGATIAIGGLLGVVAVNVGGVTFRLSSPVGALLGGLTLGHLRSRYPRFGRIPEASAKLFESMGLASFLALVALEAGPEAVAAFRTSGMTLVIASASITVLSHLSAILVGRYLIGMHPGVLLGVCAGAGTSGPALAAIEREADSQVPTIGYGMGYAVGNVLTALGGTLLVLTVTG
jgi:putative transport protein